MGMRYREPTFDGAGFVNHAEEHGKIGRKIFEDFVLVGKVKRWCSARSHRQVTSFPYTWHIDVCASEVHHTPAASPHLSDSL